MEVPPIRERHEAVVHEQLRIPHVAIPEKDGRADGRRADRPQHRSTAEYPPVVPQMPVSGRCLRRPATAALARNGPRLECRQSVVRAAWARVWHGVTGAPSTGRPPTMLRARYARCVRACVRARGADLRETASHGAYSCAAVSHTAPSSPRPGTSRAGPSASWLMKSTNGIRACTSSRVFPTYTDRAYQ